MKKVLLIALFVLMAATSYAAERVVLVGGDDIEKGTASNPVYVTGGTTGSGLGWVESGDGVAFDTDYDYLLIDKPVTFTDTITLTGGAGNTFGGTNTFSDVNASRVAVFNASKQLTDSTVTSTTLGYLDVGSSLTTLLAAKAPTASPTFTGNVSMNATLSTNNNITTTGTLYLAGNSLDFTKDATNNPSQTCNILAGNVYLSGDISISTAATRSGAGSAATTYIQCYIAGKEYSIEAKRV